MLALLWSCSGVGFGPGMCLGLVSGLIFALVMFFVLFFKQDFSGRAGYSSPRSKSHFLPLSFSLSGLSFKFSLALDPVMILALVLILL